MGSKDTSNDNVYLSSKDYSSSFNDRESHNNRGRAVENSTRACGKPTIKCGKDVKNLDSQLAEAKANVLIDIFNAPHCREFFLKCVYHLTEYDIAKAVDCANRPYVNSPIKYFNKACKQMLIQKGL